MQMKKLNAARRAWNILRITLLWARKGGVLRRRLMLNFPKYIKNLRHNHGGNTYRYGERQLSFDDTPVIHVRMHRPSSLRFKLPNIPCINPAQVDFDFDFSDANDDGFYYDDIARKSFLKSAEDQEDDEEEEYSGLDVEVYGDHENEEQTANIDTKAEEFIAKFYEQMKLQRQISYLEYHKPSTSVDQRHS
ncbi:Beta-fructofuranosidase, insoluble isoenzyme CWINV6 [Heracleum sosnowskyi]|uniref:Beta-fructofuranosidase, insoluble isoenzyme CWINV6 n=1 Tax=Heracleum sosnowskyi TaxID=360622 RepID=A0AAD8GU48_9APIA|nr:Beta-fructofuranosidase, insoluble isoenzyme CWINV6 [Heracleum sosnowskyi]